MNRRSLMLAFGIVLLLVVGGGTTLALLVLHEPEFYRRIAVPPGDQRKKLSGQFYAQSSLLFNEWDHPERPWEIKFTEAQINSFLDEDFVRFGDKTLPEGVIAPRIAIDADRVRVAFRYGNKAWSPLMSIDLHIWLAAKDPNVIALEITGLTAGALTWPAQSILERLAEAARTREIEVTWFRHNGNPVALLRFQSSKREVSVQLLQLKLLPGTLVLAGAPVGRGKPPG